MTRRVFLLSGIAASALAVRHAEATDTDLRLSVSLTATRFRVGELIPVTWTLANVSTATISIVAYHRAGGGPQYDELNVSVSRNGGAERQIPLMGPHDATQIIWRQLAPEGELRQLFDLARAMELSGNKAEPGQYRLTIAYSLKPMTDNNGQPGWSGQISAVPVSFEIYL